MCWSSIRWNASSKKTEGWDEIWGQFPASEEGGRGGDEPSRKVLKAMSLSARDLRVELKTASKTADGFPARRKQRG